MRGGIQNLRPACVARTGGGGNCQTSAPNYLINETRGRSGGVHAKPYNCRGWGQMNCGLTHVLGDAWGRGDRSRGLE